MRFPVPLHTPPTLNIVGLFKFSYSSKCISVSIVAIIAFLHWLITLNIFFMYLFSISISSLLKSLFEYIVHFFCWVFVFLLLSFESFLCILKQVFYQIQDLQIFSSTLSFHTLNSAFWRTGVFNVDEILFISVLIMFLMLL